MGCPLTTSRMRPRGPHNSRTMRRVSMSTIRRTRSSHVTASKPLSRCSKMAVTEALTVKVEMSFMV